jgi:hypothetical protein
MIRYRLYMVSPSERLRATCEEGDDLCEEFVLEFPEGGRSTWSFADYEQRAKILALLHLKRIISNPILDAPISIELFDSWWVIRALGSPIEMQQVLDYSGSELEIKLTGSPFVDEWIEGRKNWTRFPYFRTDQPEKYRVFYENDVVGWLKEPCWNPPILSGRWSPTTNAGGKQFSTRHEPESRYPITVEGPTYVDGVLSIDGDSAAIHVNQPNKE